MIVAVLDTNLIVSAVLSPRGVPSRILDAARAREFTMATSAAIIGEVLATLSRDKIRRKYHIGPDDVVRIRDLLEHEAVSTIISHDVSGVATHPEDAAILATAVSARADFLVTGDIQLQRLGVYRDVGTLSPRDFLDVLESHLPD